ncbi:Dabb family protein [Ferruginibacter sp.]|uniref:Dabb family protein n=1 Tax=Ferruginibacter sp. TaxID=1940288 RepID=UPI002657AE66|nr:Dabb family protein [Ferruginibacter sp.]
MTPSNLTRTYHSVFFTLKHPKGSPSEQAFLATAKKLAAIPGVEKFECLKQTSKQNKFEFGLSMEFATQQLYNTYNNHPAHVAFIQNHWLKEVEDFLEIDTRY